MDRMFAWLFYVTAYFFGVAATLILLAGFMDYLQSGHWNDMSLLELGYDSYLIKARWFLDHRWSWWIHDVLNAIPLSVALIVTAPMFWLLAARIDRR